MARPVGQVRFDPDRMQNAASELFDMRRRLDAVSEDAADLDGAAVKDPAVRARLGSGARRMQVAARGDSAELKACEHSVRGAIQRAIAADAPSTRPSRAKGSHRPRPGGKVKPSGHPHRPVKPGTAQDEFGPRPVPHRPKPKLRPAPEFAPGPGDEFGPQPVGHAARPTAKPAAPEFASEFDPQPQPVKRKPKPKPPAPEFAPPPGDEFGPRPRPRRLVVVYEPFDPAQLSRVPRLLAGASVRAALSARIADHARMLPGRGQSAGAELVPAQA